MITPSGGLWRPGFPVLVNHTLMILSSPVRTPDPPESWGLGMMNAFPSTTEKLIKRNSTKLVTGLKEEKEKYLKYLNINCLNSKHRK